jgi:hypothetical protein
VQRAYLGKDKKEIWDVNAKRWIKFLRVIIVTGGGYEDMGYKI